VDTQFVPVSGLVIAPDTKGPDDGRPVVTWAHGTSGLPRNCAPSLVDNPAQDAKFYFLTDSDAQMDFGVPGLTQLIAKGYVVVATDYQGLDGPGVHQYLIGETEGRNVLDAALAVRQIPQANAGAQAIAMGWSQGGQAAVWAAQLTDYLSDVKLVGAVALAPVNSLEQSRVFEQMVAAGAKLKPMSSVERGMAWYAMTVAFPELKLSDVFTPVGVDFYAQSIKVGQCNHHMGDAYAYTEGYLGPIVRTDLANQDAWSRREAQEALGVVPAKTPVAVFQGDQDTAVAPAATEAYVKSGCTAGAVIAYTAYKGVDHIRLAAKAEPDFLAWIADRFAGKAASTSCSK
jgi:pimeloyl-ACP methyl ester carboxylesterase